MINAPPGLLLNVVRTYFLYTPAKGSRYVKVSTPASAAAAAPCLFLGDDASACFNGSVSSTAGVLLGETSFVTVNVDPCFDEVAPPSGSVTSHILALPALFGSCWLCDIGAEVAGPGFMTLKLDVWANGEAVGWLLSAK